MPFANRSFPRAALALMGPALLLGACSVADGVSSPFVSARNTVTLDSLTAQRVRGANPDFAPIAAEPGNVWPEQEAPRPTLLGSPDEAMRNIPDYRPSLIEGAPPARSPLSGSSSPVPPLPPVQPQRVTPAVPPTVAPTAPRTEGRALVDPSGQPAISTGEAGRIQGFTQPGQGGGAVIRDGNVETWIGSDGQVRTRVVPPGQR
jgi:hypothetical protein